MNSTSVELQSYKHTEAEVYRPAFCGRRRAVRIGKSLAVQGDAWWRIQENLKPRTIPFLKMYP